MSRVVDIYIAREQVLVGWVKDGHYQKMSVPSKLNLFTPVLAEIMGLPEVSKDVVVYLAEDILFYSTFELDRQTPNLHEAIEMQLEMLTPYGEDSLYAYESQRHKEGFSIRLYGAERGFVEPFLRQIHTVGLRLIGLFPEGQRYLTRETRKGEWGLWVAGRFGKLLHFNDGQLIERLQCPVAIAAEKLLQRSGLETIYSSDEMEGFVDSESLLEKKAMGQKFDLLPKSYRQPDYLKGIILVLLAMNFVLLLLLSGTKLVGVSMEATRLEAEVNQLMPQVKEVAQLRSREQELESALASFEGLEVNSDFISFLDDLTQNLPMSSYLDQLRLDKKKRTIHLQGYTDDLTALTTSLQKIGNSTLKSTRKRRNQTYFHVEVSLL